MSGDDLLAALLPYQRYLPVLNLSESCALAAHINLLLRWNAKMNLTAVRDFAGAARKHVAESLFLAAQLPCGALTACDLGSGGGFPGIPAAIVRPDTEITLIESDIRKSVFLREASRSLPNVTVLARRFEELNGEFGWLLSRAVKLSSLRGGPRCAHAAVLAGEPLGPAGIVVRYSWSKVPVPWEERGYVWLGDLRPGNV